MTRFPSPLGQMIQVADIDLVVDPADHPFERANRAAIERQWALEKASQPALYNGKLMLFSSLAIDGDRLVGRCHSVDFGTLLYWRAQADRSQAGHCFAHAALVGLDDQLVAIRMGAHTANAGRVYFAAGSFELSDVRDKRVDVDANMAREVREETGLALSALSREDRYHVVATASGTVIFRRYRLDTAGEEAVERIRTHIAGDPEAEISDAVLICDRTHNPDGLLLHMQIFRDWHFANLPTF